MRWSVDDRIAFSGSATDFEGEPIAPSGLTWDIKLQHCDRISGSCHSHTIQSFTGAASGAFDAPDHDFPSYLEIALTARDTNGLIGRATRRLDPRTAMLTLASQPPGALLTFGGETATAPFTREVIQGSTNSVGTETLQTLGGFSHVFSSWSNSGARNHTTMIGGDTHAHGDVPAVVHAADGRRRRHRPAGPQLRGARQGDRVPDAGRAVGHRDRAPPLRLQLLDRDGPGARLVRRQPERADDAARLGPDRQPGPRRLEQGRRRGPRASWRDSGTGSACSTRPAAAGRCSGTTSRAGSTAPSWRPRTRLTAGSRRRGRPARHGRADRSPATSPAPRPRCSTSRPPR